MQTPLDGAVAAGRERLAEAVRRNVSGNAESGVSFLGGFAGEDGPLGPDSVAWRVHADPSMFVGGLRALLVQTLHPLAMAGVADHSDFRNDPWGRLHRTSMFVTATTYGSWAQVLDAVGTVRRVHTRVRGTAPDGTPYRASDPHLITWVHIAEIDSFLRAYQRYGRSTLTAAEADQYVAETATVAELLDADAVPRSVADLRALLELYRPELAVGEQAKDALRFLMNPPVALPVKGAYALVAAAAIGLLPGFARRDLGVPTLPLADPVLVRPSVTVALRTLRLVLGDLPTAADIDRIRAERSGAPGAGAPDARGSAA